MNRRLRPASIASLWLLSAATGACMAAPPQDEIMGDDFEGFEYPTCDGALASDDSDPKHYAAAMDLCSVVTQQSGKAGLIAATLTLADGSGTPASASHAIRAQFGAANTPLRGSAMAMLSTGHAAAQGQTNPAFFSPQVGSQNGTSSAQPADWLTANDGVPPTAPGCPSLVSGSAFDPVMLTLTLRVPGAAHSFRVGVNFYSADYPEFVCSPYNDEFVALLDSVFDGAPANPPDRNLAQYFGPAAHTFPLGVNLSMNTGLFSQCVNGPTGCSSGAIAGMTTTCVSSGPLSGTGFDQANPPGGSCGANNLLGGGTGWLLLRGNVTPGEVITLRLAIWDTSDGTYDSHVLLDDFHWSTQTVVPGVSVN